MTKRNPPLLTIDEQLLEDESLVMRIDSVLDDAVWQGTRAIDRVTHLTSQFVPTLLTELNRSLHQQENYDEFEDRLLRAVGIEDPDAPAGVLGDLDRLLSQEVRLAYNEGMVALNDGPGMIPVWEAILDDRTTPGCWANHGQRIEDLGGTVPPLHWSCRCSVRMVPDSGSSDPEFAALGAAVLEDMRADREQEFRESAVECSHRFSRLREVLGETLPAPSSAWWQAVPQAP